MQWYSLYSCSLQDTNLANEIHVGAQVRPHLLQQSPVQVKEPASASQRARWQLMTCFLAHQKLPTRHPPTACAPLLPPPSSLLSLPSEERACLSACCFAHSSCCLPSLTGLVRSSGMFGPTLGFLLGSFCASLWVDIGVVDIGKRQWGDAPTERLAGACVPRSTFPAYYSRKGGSPEIFPLKSCCYSHFNICSVVV